MPKTSFTPCATSVSTKASEGVIFCLPVTARFFWSVIVFMGIPWTGAGGPNLQLSDAVECSASASVPPRLGPARRPPRRAQCPPGRPKGTVLPLGGQRTQ